MTAAQPTRWITRERPQVERIACPWLVRRFIDPRAVFHYVPAGQVLTRAAELEATPFDVPGVALTHRWERCTFDAFLDAFQLHSPPLDRLAAIVRAADTDRCSAAPQAAGLLAIALGMARLIADDQQLLEAQLPVYDALYAWCAHGEHAAHRWMDHA